MKYHKDLDVWKRSIQLVTQIYRITETFPRSELYGLVSQIRRSAVSIPSNIAEGAGRQHKREFRQFLFVSMASSMELETQLIISENLGYISETHCENLTNELANISRMIQGLIKSIKIQEEQEDRD
jgi:four helix bundle protein